MPEKIIVSIYEIVGSTFCVASDDGERVYEQIKTAFLDDYNVELSFRNIEGLTSAFLNVAIGQLYGEFDEDSIRAKLSVKDIEPEDTALIRRVVTNAKAYFSDPERFKQVMDDNLGDNDGV